MIINRKNCIILSIFIIFFMGGKAMSDEIKKELQPPKDKDQIKKIFKKGIPPAVPCTKGRFSMRIIRPNPGIDSEIVKNTFDPNIDYKLRIIDPYTGKEITGSKGPCFGAPHRKFQPEGKRYETSITGQVK